MSARHAEEKSSYVMAILGATAEKRRSRFLMSANSHRRASVVRLEAFSRRGSPQGRVDWTVEELTPESSFAGVDIALISATDPISREYGERLGQSGIVVIDDSGVFRMDANVLLVVPEVNAQALSSMPRGIVSIPNCTTTPWSWRLPLQDTAGVKRVVVTTFQSVSGTGAAAMDELVTQTKDLMAFS